jgi:hypothetical protein
MNVFENHFDNFILNLGIQEVDTVNDIYVVHGDRIRNMSHKVGEPNQYKMDNTEKQELQNDVIELTQQHKKIVLFCPEEFGYEYESIEYFVELCLQSGVKLFIYSFNCGVNEFLKIKYPNEYSKNIIANSPTTLLQLASSQVNEWNGIKSKKLVFLNYNRKINRDLIITYLKNYNELFNSDNIISYHNNYTFNSNAYKRMYSDYAKLNGIDFDYLDSLSIVPEEVDIHKQNEAQNKAQWLHCHSKFNIICEPFFGLSDNPSEYEYYNHTLSRKVIYPILYNNVIFVHEHSPILSKILKEIGFELFFDNIDDFIKNMTDEYYYSDEVQTKLNNNRKLLQRYSGNGNKNIAIYRKKLAEEVINFFS